MIDGLGPHRLNTLVKTFGSAQKAWFAPEHDLLSLPKFPRKIIKDIVEKRNRLDPQEEIEKLHQAGIKIVFADEPEYPPRLLEIFDPPGILYARGLPEVLKKPMFAVVGARRASYYGLTVATRIARELAEAGLCVVSGMARGIDSAAHRGALEAGLPTAAVLGCGVDVVYPKENKKVMDEIITKGIVISEFPPGVKPVAGNFPQRNRIISGLAEGVLVIEAAAQSGSLITADFALEQGRDVFAVPGQVTNRLNRGAHGLIKQGAKLVEEAGDILEELGHQVVLRPPSPGNEKKSLTQNEKKVYNIILDNPVNSETIIDKTGLKSSEVLSVLLVMEMKGLVKQLPGQRYVRTLL